MHEGVDGLLRDRCRPGRQDADPIEACRQDCPPDASTAPVRGDPLDGARDGEIGWRCCVDGAGNQEGARSQSAPLAQLQAESEAKPIVVCFSFWKALTCEGTSPTEPQD
jgi:hypothetical protein